MSKTCLVCNEPHLVGINILSNRKKLDSVLKQVLGLEGKQDDCLCKMCYEQVIKVFEAKQKFDWPNPLEHKILRSNEELDEDESEPKTEIGDSPSVVKIEPKAEDEEDFAIFNAETTDFNFDDQTLKSDHKLELKANFSLGEYEEVKLETKKKEPDVSSEDDFQTKAEIISSWKKSKVKMEPESVVELGFNTDTLDSDSRQNLSDNIEEYRVHFKKEKSVDIEDTADEESKGMTEDKGPDSEELNEPNVQGNFVCEECGKSFRKIYTLKMHKKIHTRERPFLCQLCPKAFVSNCYLNLHMLTHTNKRQFACSECEKSFSSIQRLKIHNMSHTGEKPHHCLYCSKNFTTSSQLRVHVRTHTKEKPFVCSECGKGFAEKYKLRIHMRSHTKEKPYTCSDCGRNFATTTILGRHKKTHSGDKPYGCAYCSKYFKSHQGRQSHQKSHEKPRVCSDCGMTFVTWREWTLHKKIHIKKKDSHVCLECPKIFKRNCDLIVHLRSHTKEKSHICHECGNGFSTSTLLKVNHLLGLEAKQDDYLCKMCCEKVVKDFKAKPNLYQSNPLEQKILTSNGVFDEDESESKTEIVPPSSVLKIEPKAEYEENFADAANLDFEDQTLKSDHKLELKANFNLGEYEEVNPGPKTKEPDVSPKDDLQLKEELLNSTNTSKMKIELGSEVEVNFNTETLDTVMQTRSNERQFACSECEKSFSTTQRLKIHNMSHTGEKPHQCLYCSKHFTTGTQLRVHVRTHTKEKPFVCSECGKGFGEKYKLRIHMRSHTKEKPCTCSECGRSFATTTILTRHKKSHSDEKTFGCAYCSKRFKSYGGRQWHQKSHEKPRVCSDCGMTFVTWREWTLHKEIHMEKKGSYECLKCPKTFRRNCDLLAHLRSHTNEKRHICLECGKGFSTSTHLKVHNKQHTGERPFKCSHCSKGFTTNTLCKRHERTHLKEKPESSEPTEIVT